ncbi:glycoside hydrolase family 61 protein [Durotheca rogersii]|uniref:glycoside hydrolase family 61 protein n=1 Tax=Durotheca rogersii TaxID=419775 RepID=UPI00221FA450|nr:glycoside hydrolase family 61 protein [Durotheca rogersii]KAI5861452.1 glycoside hydrolase family 61 protein [Durotheca rogersii]
MKFSLVAATAFILSAEAHTIFQEVSVNGQSQGRLVGLRAPNDNNPVTDVNSQDIICQKQGTTSNQVISVSPGDKIGAYFGHIIGGAQFPNDPDHPIAKSHKGPITVWLAKVDNAATASKAGQKWFKVWEDTFDTSSKQWGVDRMIANQGWVNFSLPQCIAPGDYLMRVEILALHSAHMQNGAQFYMSCAQIRVGGSGSFSASQTVSFPGAYQRNDPSIVINIYGLAGQPDNAGKPYSAPGNVPVIQC